MTTLLGDNNKRIQFSFSNVIHECDRNTYIVEMPTLVCSSRKDAEIMQREISAFVNELSRAILNDKK